MLVESFVEWTGQIHLLLKVVKTKEMVNKKGRMPSVD